MIDEAAKYAEEDKRVHDFVTSKNEYESILHQSKQTVDEVKKKSGENPSLFNETEMAKVAELEKYSDDPDLATYSIDNIDSLKGKLESLKGVLATV
jgi:molecular chaperone DnaK (HSP70)